MGKLKTSSPPPGCGRRRVDSQSHDPNLAKQEAAQAQQQLKVTINIDSNVTQCKRMFVTESAALCQLCEQKHQTERKKWLEEKLSLIGQAKEAEDKRNQEMRKFVDDRERYGKQQSHLVITFLLITYLGITKIKRVDGTSFPFKISCPFSKVVFNSTL